MNRLFAFVVAVALVIGGATAQEPVCSGIAEKMSGLYESFPTIQPGTAEQLVTWRASCAEDPPGGDGKVVALCQATTASGTGVFYWTKESEDGENSGYTVCAN